MEDFPASDLVMIGSLLFLFQGCKADEVPVAADSSMLNMWIFFLPSSCTQGIQRSKRNPFLEAGVTEGIGDLLATE